MPRSGVRSSDDEPEHLRGHPRPGQGLRAFGAIYRQPQCSDARRPRRCTTQHRTGNHRVRTLPREYSRHVGGMVRDQNILVEQVAMDEIPTLRACGQQFLDARFTDLEQRVDAGVRCELRTPSADTSVGIIDETGKFGALKCIAATSIAKPSGISLSRNTNASSPTRYAKADDQKPPESGDRSRTAPSCRLASQLAASANVGCGFCPLVMARFPRKLSYQGY
jgi:hypothetical protein